TGMFARSGPAPVSARRRNGVRAAARGLALCSLLLVAAPAHAFFYVDNANPNASPSGPGTRAKPYSTIGAALAAHPDSGTVLVVMPGVYREKVVMDAGGTATSPIVVQADASGEVVLDGADDFSHAEQWAPAGGNVWLAAGVTWQPVQVFADGGRLAPSGQ